jgi:hypothetical protein
MYFERKHLNYLILYLSSFSQNDFEFDLYQIIKICDLSIKLIGADIGPNLISPI